MALDYKSSLSRYRRYLKVVSEKPLWKASLFAILSLGLVIVMVVFALRPTLVTIAGLGGQIKQLKEVTAKLSHKISLVQTAGEKLDQVKPREELLDSGLPEDPLWVDWTNVVVQLATDSGVRITTLNIENIPVAGVVPPEKTTNLGIETPRTLPTNVHGISFNVTVNGDYLQIKRFTSDVENLRRVAVFDKVQIDKEKDGTLTSVVAGSIGYFPQITK